MNNIVTEDDVHKMCEAKSDQLNAADLTVPRTLTIIKVEKVIVNGKILAILHYEGGAGRPYKPSKGMIRIISKAWGNKVSDWVGEQMTVFCEPTVVYAAKEVGGIRICNMTKLDKPTSFMVTIARNKKERLVINPLANTANTAEPLSQENKDNKAKSIADEICVKIKGFSTQKEVDTFLLTKEKAMQRFKESYKELYQQIIDSIPDFDDDLDFEDEVPL